MIFHANTQAGHLLVTARDHKVKVADLDNVESRDIGMFFKPFSTCYINIEHETGFWLPILARTVAKVTGVTDYNIVQNNGMS